MKRGDIISRLMDVSPSVVVNTSFSGMLVYWFNGEPRVSYVWGSPWKKIRQDENLYNQDGEPYDE